MSLRCHKAIFAFRADHPALAPRCLTLKEGECVRVVYTEPLRGGHWCIAQAADGRFGLVPLFALCKTTEDEAFSPPPSVWDQILPPEGDVASGAPEGGGVAAAARHVDPTAAMDAFGISEADEIVHLLDQDGGGGAPGAPSGRQTRRDSLITVSSSTSESNQHNSTAEEEEEEEGGRAPPHRRCTAAALDFANVGDSSGEEEDNSGHHQQQGWKEVCEGRSSNSSSNGSSTLTDRGAEELEVMARQSCHRSRGGSPVPAAAVRGTAILIRKSKERGLRGAQRAQTSALAAWARNAFDRCWAQLPPLERSSETRRQLRELIQTQLVCSWMEAKAAELETRRQQTRDRAEQQQQVQREAARTAEQAESRLERQCEAWRELLEELRHGGVVVPIQLLLERNDEEEEGDGGGGGLRAEHITPIKERPLNALLRRPAEDKKRLEEERQMREVLAADVGTFKDYLRQEGKLQKRHEKVCRLQERLREESASLAVSEKALAALVAPGDFELLPRETAGAAAAADPLLTPTKEQQQQQEEGALPPFRFHALKPIQWPRTLAGLTDEEEEALRNYVRLYDKYVLRYEEVQKKKQSYADHNLDEKKMQQLVGELEEWSGKLAAKVAEVEKIEHEIKQREAFVAKYDAVAKKIEEQLQIGEHVLAQKKAKLQKLTSSR